MSAPTGKLKFAYETITKVEAQRDELLAAITKTVEKNLTCKSTQARLAASWGYVKAQPEQEPFAWMHKIDCVPDDRNDFMAYYKRTPGYCIPLYTSPPKREWAGLTDDDMDCLFPHGSTVWVQETVKSIEAKLKEKNT